MSRPTIGFIGLGVMGSAMSSQLMAAGFPVVGYDVDPKRMAEHLAREGLSASSPDEVAGTVGVLVMSLPGAPALEQVVDGIGAHPGLVVIEASTLSVQTKTVARDRLAERGVTLLDCPVSGTGQQARDGDLVGYLSGEDAAKEHVRPVLAAMTRNVHDLGQFGSGTMMKLIANHLVAIHNVAAAEALLLARRAGLDLDQVLAAVADGAGASRMFEVRGPLMAKGRYLPATATVHTMVKDVALIQAFADTADSPAPLLEAATLLYQDAIDQGRGQEDTACVYAVLEGVASIARAQAGC